MTTHEPGSEIAGYRIESVIGSGGMAIVYRAEDMRLGRKVALKLLTPQLAGNDEFRRRFIMESRLAASLDHPNIVPIYEAGEADGQLFIAMRYVVGSDLKGLLGERGGQLPVEWTLRLFEQIGNALDSAHRAGLVHRDVKPANILIATGEQPRHALGDHVYLTDFGLTKRAAELSGGLTGTGHFLGTVAYVSPEQIQGKPVGPATDIYALGCMLYECLTGWPPFRRDDDAAMLWAHLVETPPAVTAIRPEVPPGVDAVVARAMAKEPERRYESCAELVRELELALRVPTPVSGASGKHAQNTGESTVLSLELPDEGGTPEPQAEPVPAASPGRRRRSTRRTVIISAAALAVLAIALFAVIVGPRSSQPTTSPAAAGATATPAPSSAQTPAGTPTPTPTPTPALTPAAAVGVFAGRTSSSGVGLSFALDGGKATAYVCDGRTFEIWMEGTVNGDQVTMSGPGGAALTGVVNQQALSGQITTPKGQIDFLAEQAPPPAGVYRAEIQINGKDAYLGWSVLPDGTQLGAINSGQGVTPAPALTIDSTTTPATATFSLNGQNYHAEVVKAGQPLWTPESLPTS
jgi:serine/threonine protein kinase